ncbi:hypothetical protein SAMN05421827_104102 [Pedobacter terrae]|uniref:YXWGXW repeat-containing protein n=1 Tax=Pedobacter terrae TaxID=405671 RepID=A0A1G7SAI9_9SPHI|nr:DUF6600 domain-containing protein [Pedobacter terrae]SDG20003.1 hypothetical protein SAMN05421827_104102 [Pedobacter terrae]
MKTLKSTALVLGLFSLLAGTTTLVRAQDYQNDYQSDGYSTGNISLQTFYDELSPYGTWIQDPQYGYVWRPNVDQSEFRPYYTNGRWAMTEYGNTWVSNYDWGWAPFHYGRWVINSYRQWIWLPDTNWGPAWVDWRSGDGYYGWAPMAPSISINLSFGRRYMVPEFCWNFIPQRNIYINTFPRYDYGRNNVYIRNTTIINNTYVYNRRTYYGGPRVEDIRRATNRDVTVYRYAQSSRPGASRIGGREVAIYRPRPERNAAVDNRNAAPRRFEQGNAGISRGGRNEGYTDRDQRGNTPGNNDNRVGSRDNRNVGRDNNNQPNNRGEAYNKDANGRISRGGTNGIDNGNRQDNANRGQDQQRLDQIRQQRNQDRMGVDQQRNQRDMQPQRGQDDQRAQMEQQRAQRNEQMQQQRAQQAQQQQQDRAQRNVQMQQQRNEQMQQQRAQQAQQQQQERAQRDAQAQQQRNEQMQQQRAQQAQQQQQERAQRDAQAQQQRNEQMQQQRAQQAQQQQQERAQRDAQAQQQRAQQQQQRQEQRRSEAPQQRGGGESGRPSRGGRG